MATKYPLLEPLEACTEEEINAVFELLDELDEAVKVTITLDWVYEITPSLSGGEADVVFKSWKVARGRE